MHPQYNIQVPGLLESILIYIRKGVHQNRYSIYRYFNQYINRTCIPLPIIYSNLYNQIITGISIISIRTEGTRINNLADMNSMLLVHQNLHVFR